MSDYAGIIAAHERINRQWSSMFPPGNTFALNKRIQNSKKFARKYE